MKYIKIIYFVLSGLSFLLVVGILSIFIFSYSPMGTSYSHNPIFTLNHGNITTDQEYEVIYSHQSPPLFNGDHLDYYCIEIEKFEFQTPRGNDWVFGLEENPLFSRARKQAAIEGDISRCFNGEFDAESNDIAAKIWSIDANRTRIEGAVIIFYHRKSSRLLYVSSQT